MSSTRAALARTYRPRRFSEMATQEHVSETLRAAVARGRAAHAYLFCGPRGVGKTTAARVLAMALNCAHKGDDGEPCGECDSCDRIWAGRTSLDVIEIDAASNRGVDDARDLRERAMYAPTDDKRFKVYIIDEAHMLTREAWNALLKVLEEPPPRVIFVFATTEPQKIQQAAAPILSRCQRFDFRRITVSDIVRRLENVLAAENVSAEPEALLAIARRADGGLRDALSLLDQVLSFTDSGVTTADVRRVLGLVGEDLYLELLDIIADRRFADVFRFVQRLLDDGYDLTEFYRGLADALRTTLVFMLDGAEAAEIRDELRPAYQLVADRFAAGDLLRMLALTAELDTEGRFRKSANPRTMLEVLLLRFAYLDRTLAVEDLIRAAGGADPGDAGDGARPPQPPAEPVVPRSGRSLRELLEAANTTAAPAPPQPAVQPRKASTSPEAATPRPAANMAPVEAARDALQDRDVIPHGMGVLLRAAEVLDNGSGVSIRVPPGPALERLTGDSAVIGKLRRAVAERAGRPVEIEVLSAGEPDAAQRITPEQVRGDQLNRLTRNLPQLAAAVEAWDLELID